MDVKPPVSASVEVSRSLMAAPVGSDSPPSSPTRERLQGQLPRVMEWVIKISFRAIKALDLM